MDRYNCLKENEFRDDKGYALRPVRMEEREKIRNWRNSQIDLLRQDVPISEKEQERYFQEEVAPLFEMERPPQLLFSFYHRGELIGYGGLTPVDWRYGRSEVSFLLDPERKGFDEEFRAFLSLIRRIAFEELKLHRLMTESYAFRKELHEILEDCGFVREGVLREHVYKRGGWVDSYIHGLLNPGRSTKSEERFAVLITSISRKVPLIRSVRRAAERLSEAAELFGCDSDHDCAGRGEVERFWESPPIERLSFEEAVSFCSENGITAIIPTRDGDLPFYAENRERFAEKGVAVMVSPHEAVEICRNKALFAKKLEEWGLPAIPTAEELDAVEAERVVVKENYGSGARRQLLDAGREEALQFSRQLQEPVFQPYIEGREWSVDLYRTRSKKVKGVVARRRERVLFGESQVTTTAKKPELEALCEELAGRLDLYGHAVFQAIEDAEGKFHFVECNPRFGGASTASIAAGLESFYWFFLESRGKGLAEAPFRRASSEIKLVRYPKDRFIAEAGDEGN